MTLDIATILGYIILPILTIVVFPIVRSKFLEQEQRIKELEDKMEHTTTEPQVRQLIKDKYDYLQEDIREIKNKLDKLFDMYVQQNKNEGKKNG